MLRGRRLQARAIGVAVRRGFAKLRHLLGGGRGGSGAPRHPGDATAMCELER
jgi:hypothetical protein